MKLSGRRIRQDLVPLAVALLELLALPPSQAAPAESIEAFLSRYYQAIPVSLLSSHSKGEDFARSGELVHTDAS